MKEEYDRRQTTMLKIETVISHFDKQSEKKAKSS